MKTLVEHINEQLLMELRSSKNKNLCPIKKFSELKIGDTIIYMDSKGEIEKYKVKSLDFGYFGNDNLYTDKSNEEIEDTRLTLGIEVREKYGFTVNGDDCWECNNEYFIAASEENWECLEQFAYSHGLLK